MSYTTLHNAASRKQRQRSNSDADQFRWYLATDPEYLLRCSLTHDWDHIVQFGQYLMEYCAAAAYQTPRRPLRQLQACDQYGNSVLQAACYYQPPVIAIRALLKVAKKLGIQQELLYHRSLDKSTALQVACATGASVAVIEALLEVATAPKDDASWCVASAVTDYDQQGSTPLSELVVQYTLEHKGPAHLANSRALEQIQDIDQECQRSILFKTFWSKIEMLLLSTTTSQQQQQQPLSLLHGAAQVAHTCPSILCDLLVRCLPHELSRPTAEGWLPMHLALSCGISGSSNDQQPCILKQQQQYFVSHLLHAHPQAAQIPIPLVGGKYCFARSPFCHAVLEGLPWHATTRSTSSKKAQREQGGILQSLWTVAPEAVGQRDEATGCHPFKLAALLATTTTNQQRQDQDLEQLDTIYHLLRLHPQVLFE